MSDINNSNGGVAATGATFPVAMYVFFSPTLHCYLFHVQI
jgi:hypothetical protein